MQKYALNFDARCFMNGNTLHVRKGVWNTVDGTINVAELEQKEVFVQLVSRLQEGQTLSEEDLKALDETGRSYFDEMVKAGFVIECAGEVSSKEALKLLIGNATLPMQEKARFTLVSDSPLVLEEAQRHKETYAYEFDALSANLLDELGDINLFPKMDALELKAREERYGQAVGDAPIVVLLTTPNLALLQNLSYLAKNKQPLFVGCADGPFMFFTAIKPGLTACWSCFEQRMASSVEDHILYSKFINIKNSGSAGAQAANLHMSHLFFMALQEVVTWSSLKMSKMMGRAFFVYLPTFEFHYHEILKIASCPQCGHLAQGANRTNHFALNRIIKEYIAEGKQ